MQQEYPIILNRKIRFALVGCGRISGKHIEALVQHKNNAEVVAVCDVNKKRLIDTVEKTGTPGYVDIGKLLENEAIDVVVLATPSGLHSEQAERVAEAGIHVVTEKPMATRWQDGVRMVEACEKSNVRLFVVKQNRKNQSLQLLNKVIRENRLGRVYAVNINVFWTRPQEYYDLDDWRGTWRYDGGALMNQASHYVDLLTWLIGPVESVYANTATLARDIEVEDTATLNIRWRSGALGTMAVTMLTYPKNFEGSITVIGELGTVRIGGVAVNRIQHWELFKTTEANQPFANASYAVDTVYGMGHAAYYENVISALRGEAEPDTDGREGLKSLEVLIAAYRSARNGRAVDLPLGK